MDFLNEYNKQAQINENLFGKIFSKKPESQQTPEPEITPGPELKKTRTKIAPQFNPKKLYSFNMNKISALGLGDLGKVFLNFKSSDEFALFQKILQFIKGGYLANDLNALQKAVKYGEVDGYGPYQYLSSVFSSPGTNISKILPTQHQYRYGRKVQEGIGDINFTMPKTSTIKRPTGEVPERYTTLESMKRLEMFVRYFVENIVDEKGMPNTSVQGLIINKIKEILGTNKPQLAKLPPHVKGKLQVEPGTQKKDVVGDENGDTQTPEIPGPDTKSSLDILKKQAQAQSKEKKRIQKEIRDLLKDNF